jgi:YhcH/YjgK/YiaL family protein
MEYVPAMENESVYESHRKYIDIQRVVAGEEWLYKADVMKLHRATEYDTLNDVVLYRDSVQRGRMLLRPGTCVVLYPEDAHRTARRIDAPVKKIVGKLRIE